MDERQIQHRIVQALLGTVGTTGLADLVAPQPGARDWATADPYIIRHLAAHAAAGGDLGTVAAEPCTVPERTHSY